MRKTLPAVTFLLFASGCSSVPSNFFSAPKELQLDGNFYLACTDFVYLYSPSRDIASSSAKTYEFTFIDDYGQEQDVKDISTYTIREAPNATFAMPSPVPGPEITTYRGGTHFTLGSIIRFGENGKGGRARYVGPGEWKPVPCGFAKAQ
jgi:hypothetical protein